MKKIDCYVDGATEPKNPGGTGSYGIYATSDGEVVLEAWGIVGSGPLISNNVSEYSALFNALTKIKEKFGVAVSLTIYSDSQMVVKQMNREWPVRAGLYVEMAQRTLHFATQFHHIRYVWIPRERNAFADALSKRALTEVGVSVHPSRR